MRALKRLLPHRPSAARGASLEFAIERRIALALWERGWRPQVLTYTGYGASAGPDGGGWVRIFARVLLLPAADQEAKRKAQRGWRQFLTLSLANVQVVAEVSGREHILCTNAGGYVDSVLPWDGDGGWHDVRVRGQWSAPATGHLRVVGPDEETGIISDIDDTVMVTAIPRPLLAFWNSFVRVDTSRKPVAGMPDFFQRVLQDRPDSFVAYLSTGAWNVAPSIRRFLQINGYPDGPLLMTDWGPSTERWFRSGRGHKRTALRRLTREFPQLRWVLIGDDGQHDPVLYDDLICDAPGRVELVAIRELTPTEQVLTHGTPVPLPEASEAESPPSNEQVTKIRAGDGLALIEEYERQSSMTTAILPPAPESATR